MNGLTPVKDVFYTHYCIVLIDAMPSRCNAHNFTSVNHMYLNLISVHRIHQK